MQVKKLFHTQTGDPACRCNAFPGAVQLPDGSLLLMCVAGDEFESSDHHLVQLRSYDLGHSWSLDGDVYDHGKLSFDFPFTDSAKPTLLSNGNLIAAGYGFVRDQPEMGLSGYAEKFGHFPECKNFILRSCDNGKSWSMPDFFTHKYIGMEISGPVLQLQNGELMFFASPFGLQADEQIALAFSGGKSGEDFQELSCFYQQSGIAAWEVRSCQLASGRIVLVIWAYDLKNQRHLNNHLVYSDDNGRSWSQPIDSNLPGQAANLLADDDRLLLLQTRREGENCGLYLHEIDLSASGELQIKDSLCVMNSDNLASACGNIEKQFCSLKFGQPSLLKLANGSYLLCYWQAFDDIYRIQIQGLEITF